jgi:Xaa-Pro dipeptidase
MTVNFAARMERLKQKALDASLDAFLVTAQDSIYYLTGASYKPLERPFFIIVRPLGEPDLVVPELERTHMSKAEGFKTVLSYFEYPAPKNENWYDRLHKLLHGCKRIGVENSVSAETMKELDTFTLIPCGLINELRLIKTEDEIRAIRRTAVYADKGMERLVRNLYSGVSVLELFSLSRGIQTEIIKSGNYDPLNSEFLTVGWPAPKSAQPHSIPELNDRLTKGPLSLMSFHRINGYAAECERTVFMGTPSADQKELFEHMRKAREVAFGMVKPGASCSDIDAATKDYFQKNGLSQYILHRTGHGIGLGNHEAPWLSEGSEDILQKDMVISIEPAVYLPEIGGFRHSDTVLVTDTGYESLTKFPTPLDQLTLPTSNTLKAAKGWVIRKAVGLK